MNFKAELIEMRACRGAVAWVGDRDLETAWSECERGDRMMWLLTRWPPKWEVSVDLACGLAESVLHLVPDGEDSPKIAVKTARGVLAGTHTKKQAAAAEAAVRAAVQAAAWAAASIAKAAEAAAQAAAAAVQAAAWDARAAVQAAEGAAWAAEGAAWADAWADASIARAAEAAAPTSQTAAWAAARAAAWDARAAAWAGHADIIREHVKASDLIRPRTGG